MRVFSASKSPAEGLDFMPLLLVTVVLFVIVSIVQFSQGWAGGHHGLLLFEKACALARPPS